MPDESWVCVSDAQLSYKDDLKCFDFFFKDKDSVHVCSVVSNPLWPMDLDHWVPLSTSFSRQEY